MPTDPLYIVFLFVVGALRRQFSQRRRLARAADRLGLPRVALLLLLPQVRAPARLARQHPRLRLAAAARPLPLLRRFDLPAISDRRVHHRLAVCVLLRHVLHTAHRPDFARAAGRPRSALRRETRQRRHDQPRGGLADLHALPRHDRGAAGGQPHRRGTLHHPPANPLGARGHRHRRPRDHRSSDAARLAESSSARHRRTARPGRRNRPAHQHGVVPTGPAQTELPRRRTGAGGRRGPLSTGGRARKRRGTSHSASPARIQPRRDPRRDRQGNPLPAPRRSSARWPAAPRRSISNKASSFHAICCTAIG